MFRPMCRLLTLTALPFERFHMEQEAKDKLAINVANSWKMASNWVMGVAGIAFGYYLSMPQVDQQKLVAHLPIDPYWFPIIASAIGYAARVWPQKSITPFVAAAKSDSTPESKP